MSKTSKLFRHPVLFFKDAIKNRLASLELPDADDSSPGDRVDKRIQTFIIGFSPWKQFLRSWFPDRHLIFLPKAVKRDEFERRWAPRISRTPHAEVFIWGFKAEAWLQRWLASKNVPVTYVEDGFIRSIGLGAQRSLPFSLSLDRKAPYFDARTATELEDLLNTYDFDADPALLARAERLMQVLVDNGLSKYNHARPVAIDTLYGQKTGKRILVVGQVEDDASIKYGSQRAYTNNDLVMIARLENPDAHIIYKPHPDVLNRLREQRSDPAEVSHLCQVLDVDVPLAQALQTIDHVYTITSQVGFEALVRGIHVTVLGCPFYAGWGLTDDRQPCTRRQRRLTLTQLFAAAYLLYPRYFDPVYKVPLTAEQAVERLLQFKQLERLEAAKKNAVDVAVGDDPQKIPTFVVGFSPWKEFMLAWFPERRMEFLPRKISSEEFNARWKSRILSQPHAEIFVWGFKVEPWLLRFAAANDVRVIYVEDGFIRSIGLGASKTPPFSLTLDSRTPYFNARAPSDLEHLLSTHDFDNDPELMARADRLLDVLLQTGLSKYNHAANVDIESIYGPKTRRRVLVVGQVEDDASIRFGCERGYSNNDLVMIAALENPDAHVIYKPHPDVLNGHRAMASNPADVAHLCQVLTQDVPLAKAFETIDHVYTITSQAGFEALMRGIPVTTMGCPFYSGWGLTDDRQPNLRRTRKLTMRQVFAAAYLLYPSYFDPVYKERLSAEQAVERLVYYKSVAQPPTGATAPAPEPEHEPSLASSRPLPAETPVVAADKAPILADGSQIMATLCAEMRALGREIATLNARLGSN